MAYPVGASLVARHTAFIDHDADGFVLLIQHHDAHWYFEAAIRVVLGKHIRRASVHHSHCQNAAIGTCSTYDEGRHHAVLRTFIDNFDQGF
jgi:hypothetical protein